jgi:uncharacterized protein (TIGR03382 family)
MRAAIVLVAIPALTLVSPPALACRPMPCDGCDDWRRYPVVFDGVVADIDGDVEEGPHPVRFAVQHGYRGVFQPEVVVHTMGTRAQCGFGFTEGQRYLVQAVRDPDGRLWERDGTRHLGPRELPPLPPPRFAVVRERPGGPCSGCAAAGSEGASAVLLLILAGWIRRHWPKAERSSRPSRLRG